MNSNYLKANKKPILYGVLLIFTLIIIVCWLILNKNTFYSGIMVEGIDISPYTESQARTLIENKLDRIYKSGGITLNRGVNKWYIKADSISFKPLIDDALEEANKIGKDDNIFARLYRIISLKFKNQDIKVNVQINKDKLCSELKSIKSRVDKNPKSASVFYDGKFVFDKDEKGYSMDISRNLDNIIYSINSENSVSIDLLVDEVVPKIQYEKIKEINCVLSSATTTFDKNNINRCENIALACKKINGTVLLPEDVFSLNGILGARTLENGYKEAQVILNNELVDGIGGGVCQVATTLYHAVLKAGLSIVERRNHSMVPSYIEPGFDATISEGYIDFKFRNNLDYAVCLNAEVLDGDKIVIKISGRKLSDAIVIELKSEVMREFVPVGEEIIIDDNVPLGERIVCKKARNGLKVCVNREYYNKSGVLVYSEKISEDVYEPVRCQVRINSKEG